MTDPASPEPSPPDARAGRFALSLVGVGIAVAVMIWVVFPPDGQERSTWLQVIGRVHPLVVHLPIGLLLLVPVLEIMGTRREWGALREAAGFVLGLGVLATLGGVLTGWLLAFGGGESYPRVEPHMASAVKLVVVASLTAWVRVRWSATGRRAWRNGYAALLVATTGMLAYTGHQGGALTYGPSFLTELLPGRMRAWLGDVPAVSPPAKVSDSESAIFAAHIQPIFETHCTKCHGAEESEGELQLDTFKGLMAGGEDGPVITPGNPLGSELYRRVILPPTAKKVMPSKPNRNPSLSAEELRLIEWWITEGATESMTVAEAKFVPSDVRAILAQSPKATGR